MQKQFLLLAASLALVSLSLEAQVPDPATSVMDSIVVVGANRVPADQIITQSGLATGQPLSYRDVQRAVQALFATGQFDDVRIMQGEMDGRAVMRIEVVERPLLTAWNVRGPEIVPERTVRGRVALQAGRPYDPAAAQRSLAAIDSLYKQRGYYLADVRMHEDPAADGTMRVMFEITEGRRVAVSQVIVEGNEAFTDEQVVSRLATRPEGFWWFRKGEYDDDALDDDVRSRLPAFYGSHGFIDFQVVDDTLIVHEESGKGTLVLTVSEGEQYEVGDFEIVGNRQFSTEQLEALYPFGSRTAGFLGLGGQRRGQQVFDEARWIQAAERVQTLYSNNGYLYAQVQPVIARRTGNDGRHMVDLRWQIQEGQPAVINRVDIIGNTVTHESVIRRAIVMVPGDVFRQEALIRSYQNISNLGFFEQPLQIPRIEPDAQGDVDVVFQVDERRTGNVNFGASMGQGVGVGGFIGLDEPNVLGRAKRISLQWQFGRNISDFRLTYSDPAIQGRLISGSVSVHSSRLRYTIADLGRINSRGATFQLGFPLRGSRYSRVFTSYTVEQSTLDSPGRLQSRFACANCTLSSAGLSLLRDTRIELPFPTGGAMHEVRLQQGGGILGGSGNFQRATVEGRWYVPLAQLGGDVATGGQPLKVLAGYTAKAGFVWGDPGPHFRQLFTLGGTQFGVPLRGYEEFSVTPLGFDPFATGSQASTVEAFGQSYFAMTAEVGLRISQALYVNAFLDAGNVWARAGEFNPTRLYRGVGLGLSILSPLGPIGLDYALGLDRTDLAGNPDPGWKFHFRLGNIF